MIRHIFILLFVTVFSVFNNSFSQNHWTQINSPVSKSLTNCFFVNSQTGWMSGDSGTIIQTSNGGISWTVQNSGTFENIQDIFFLNERLGWALAFNVFPDSNEFPGTLILKTTNGGNNWIRSMFPDTNRYMFSVYYMDSLKGCLGGIGGNIVLTTNGGNTWTYTDTDTADFPVYKIRFYDHNLGYACGGLHDWAGHIWVTSNGGLNWTVTHFVTEQFFDLDIIDKQKIICVGGHLVGNADIAISSDQGLNWNSYTTSDIRIVTGIDHRTKYEIWASSEKDTKFIYSIDTGATWTILETPNNSKITDLDFTDSVTGFACGVNGVILKYDKLTSVPFNNSYETSNPDFNLYQNYPNPFNPKTIINYTIPSKVKGQTSNVKLIIYNSLGIEVTTIVDEFQKPGEYKVEFDAGNLSSGIYWYKLTSGDHSITKKMVVVK